MKLENWGMVAIGDPYQAPETRRVSFNGEVYGHPRFEDGNVITTSTIVGYTLVDGSLTLTTVSGSSYTLGNVNPVYEEMYPDALNRVVAVMKSVFG